MSCKSSIHSCAVLRLVLRVRIGTAAVMGMILLGASVSLRAADSPVTAMAFAPDGESLVAGSQAGLIVYSWPELAQRKTLRSKLLSIHDLVFSPDGRTLAVGGGIPAEEGQVELIHWPGGEAQTEFTEQDDTVMSVAWNRAGFLAAASLDHSVTVWDVGKRQLIHHLHGHSRGVTTVDFPEDSTMLLTGGLDNNLRLWDLKSGSVIRSFNNHTRRIHRLAMRPHGPGLPMAASISADRTVRFWQPTIGRMVRFRKLTSTPLDLAWFRDGSRLAVSCEDGHIRWLDPDTVEILGETSALDGWAWSLSAHPSDGSLAVGGRNAQIRRVVLSTTR